MKKYIVENHNVFLIEFGTRGFIGKIGGRTLEQFIEAYEGGYDDQGHHNGYE